jgi:uncharacterized membrane protein YphA (DoxX/SURF4 family)
VQRLFSMFPRGFPGIALLLLRFSVAGALLFQDSAHRHDLPVWIVVVSILLSIVLVLGYLTPFAAAISVLFHVSVACVLSTQAGSLATIGCFDALALALVGPGAYSLDSHFFGRRVVHLGTHQ